MCDSSVPAGRVRVTDEYDGQKLIRIFILFSPADVDESALDEVSDAFTIQAQKWLERGGRPNSGGPYRVLVERRSDLPDAQIVVDETEVGRTLYLIDEDVMTEAGARALERMLRGRALTWGHLD
ncbi:hypothetical protein I3F58_02075 [Streptomyces sp. MUM 203J]|uniref:hypothetical protein n=1 Tax=Streptomyces sp. MUM 203J TaxID=2791990 RepID=UPI001F04F0D7|nr:hypothetical protein [Streptomyces sp. MUM 203J]MCH0538367.1 hypothetical protein [Streptomyces sp. MUM 203J]